jgi:enhancing lycopene biosynthesis protein 2
MNSLRRLHAPLRRGLSTVAPKGQIAVVRRLSTAAPKGQIAVVLSGSGVYDGSECTEAVAALVHVSRAGYTPVCFAPDKEQHHVVDHTTGDEQPAPRNSLVESARIARGAVKPLADLDAYGFAALVVPGGFGAAKNLCNHATVAQGDASKMVVDADLEAAIKAFHAAKKPIGMCCIAPVIAAHVLKATVTVGEAEGAKWPYGGTVGAVEAYGGTHQAAPFDGVCVDAENMVVTSPAYMYEGQPHEIFDSVGVMVSETLRLQTLQVSERLR